MTTSKKNMELLTLSKAHELMHKVDAMHAALQLHSVQNQTK